MNKHDMTNQFVIVTGASSGLGKSTASDLLAHGAKVVYACRNKQNAMNAINEIPEKYRENATFIELDLCSFKSIQTFADRVKKEYPQVNILINNAGACPDNYNVTGDNLESFVQGNHLGPMLLTILLLDHFSPSKSRIINVSSKAHFRGDLSNEKIKKLLNPEKIKEYYFCDSSHRWELYSSTKLMNIFFTQYLAEFLPKKYNYIKAAALHPGVVNTSFFRFVEEYKILSIILKVLTPLVIFLFKTSDEGAQTQLHLSYIPFENLTSGAYYSDCSLSEISVQAKDSSLRNSFMNWSISTIKEKVPNFEVNLWNYFWFNLNIQNSYYKNPSNYLIIPNYDLVNNPLHILVNETISEIN